MTPKKLTVWGPYATELAADFCVEVAEPLPELPAELEEDPLEEPVGVAECETEPRPDEPAAERIDLHSEFAEAAVATDAEPEKAQALLLLPCFS